MSAINEVLQSAVNREDVRGVTAIAATSRGPIYQGAFGKPHINATEDLSLDSIFRIASMTKAVTSVAAMQLVERGVLELDSPISNYIPSFNELQVLESFDEITQQPVLRKPSKPNTIRQLLSHTAGFEYEIWNRTLKQAVAAGEIPSLFAPEDQFLQAPLVFDPGSRWGYGINADWLGRLIEIVSGRSLDVVFKEQIFDPLGMQDTHFNLPKQKLDRLVASNARQKDGSLQENPVEAPPEVSFFRGGEGLYSSAEDYSRFLRALLCGGRFAGAQILKPDTVALMGQNQIGELEVTTLESVSLGISNSFNMLPNSSNRFGLGFLINGEAVEGGRAAKSLTWAGLHNSYFWIDPVKDVCAVLMMQLLPFYDSKAVAILEAFEQAVYANLEN